MERSDFLVIGAGMAGASIAAELAPHGTVTLLEMESQPAYHTTGRSAALYAPSYGGEAVRALTRASKSFFDQAQDQAGCDSPLLRARGALFVARADQAQSLEHLAHELSNQPQICQLDARAALAQCSILRPDYVHAALLDASAMDVDVHALLQLYLRRLRANGGVVRLRCAVEALQHDADGWTVASGTQSWRARIVVNAAGAWAEAVGALAGAQAIGLTPKRRTALTVAAAHGTAAATCPAVIDCDEQFYLRPEAGRWLISPADETPSPPCDAQADEYDVAVCVDRIQRAFDLPIARIESKWAGLRSFVADGAPVCGFDGQCTDFFWFAGQGGYGIQMAPALARLGAAWARGKPTPQDIVDQGLQPAQIQPQRLAARASGDQVRGNRPMA